MAVTVVDSPFSVIEAGLSCRVTLGGPSSSTMVRVAGSTLTPVAVAATVTVWSAAAVWLSVAVSVTLPVLLVSPVAMVSVVPLCVVPVAGDAETVSVMSVSGSQLALAVTVVDSPFSAIEAGSRCRYTVGVSGTASAGSIARPAPDRLSAPTRPEMTRPGTADTSTRSAAWVFIYWALSAGVSYCGSVP